jgi:hypothetical protein
VQPTVYGLQFAVTKKAETAQTAITQASCGTIPEDESKYALCYMPFGSSVDLCADCLMRLEDIPVFEASSAYPGMPCVCVVVLA